MWIIPFHLISKAQRKNVRTKTKWTRILLFLLFSSSLDIQDIFIYNKTVTKRPEAFSNLYVYIFAYIPSSKNFILSTRGGIISSPQDRSTYTSLSSSLKLHDMAVEDNKRLVFMLDITRPNCLAMMNINNSTFEELYRFTVMAKSLAVYAKQNICYIGMRNTIISITYVGTHFKIRKTGEHAMRVFSMDTDINELYFLECNRVKTMSLSGNEVTPRKEKYVQDVVYNNIVLYSVTSNSVKKVSQNVTVAIHTCLRVACYRMCLLP